MMSEILGDRYAIEQLLGKNAGRRTFLARDLHSQEAVIVKLLLFGQDFEWDQLKLFEREAKILQTLDCPAIPRYRDYFELETASGKGFALVQTYIEAKSLEAHLKDGRNFDESELKEIARLLLDILAYLHERNPPVIHRDLKPSNILLANRSGHHVGQVYLVDFGSVQTLAAREGGTLTVVGTYGYMPPEQFGGRATPASDLYSLGATLIYLATGRHPADLPQEDLRLQFEALTSLSPALILWLKKLVEPSLNRRFSSAKTALDALENLDHNPPVTSLVYKRPANSKVSLKKESESLEILIPSSGFEPGTAALMVFAIAWNSFVFFWTLNVLSTPFPFNVPFVLFSLPFWTAGGGMILAILFTVFGRTYLRLDPKQIALTYELFGFKYHRPPPSRRQDIDQLERIQRAYQKDSEGDRIEIKPQINIWAGTHKYELGSHGTLSEPEINWLSQELSDWLGIPITP